MSELHVGEWYKEFVSRDGGEPLYTKVTKAGTIRGDRPNVARCSYLVYANGCEVIADYQPDHWYILPHEVLVTDQHMIDWLNLCAAKARIHGGALRWTTK